MDFLTAVNRKSTNPRTIAGAQDAVLPLRFGPSPRGVLPLAPRASRETARAQLSSLDAASAAPGRSDLRLALLVIRNLPVMSGDMGRRLVMGSDMAADQILE